MVTVFRIPRRPLQPSIRRQTGEGRYNRQAEFGNRRRDAASHGWRELRTVE